MSDLNEDIFCQAYFPIKSTKEILQTRLKFTFQISHKNSLIIIFCASESHFEKPLKFLIVLSKLYNQKNFKYIIYTNDEFFRANLINGRQNTTREVQLRLGEKSENKAPDPKKLLEKDHGKMIDPLPRKTEENNSI